jgi:hypothetical protein
MAPSSLRPERFHAARKSSELQTVNIYVGQIYIDAHARYPFSIKWQEYLSKNLTELGLTLAGFEEAYGRGTTV